MLYKKKGFTRLNPECKTDSNWKLTNATIHYVAQSKGEKAYDHCNRFRSYSTHKIWHSFILSKLGELLKSDKGNSQNNIQQISYFMINH